MQKVHGQTLYPAYARYHSPPIACRSMILGSFTRLTAVLFNFPSRYLCTIGLGVVFSLGPWSAQIPTGFHVSRGTWDTSRVLQNFAYEAFTRYGVSFQILPLSIRNPTLRSHNPAFFLRKKRFRLFPLRSPLLRESL